MIPTSPESGSLRLYTLPSEHSTPSQLPVQTSLAFTHVLSSIPVGSTASLNRCRPSTSDCNVPNAAADSTKLLQITTILKSSALQKLLMELLLLLLLHEEEEEVSTTCTSSIFIGLLFPTNNSLFFLLPMMQKGIIFSLFSSPFFFCCCHGLSPLVFLWKLSQPKTKATQKKQKKQKNKTEESCCNNKTK